MRGGVKILGMEIAEYHLQQEVDRLKRVLEDAIGYLRLMPRSPVTLAKIAEMERSLESTPSSRELRLAEPWVVSRTTPVGERLALRATGRQITFETACALPAGAVVPFDIDQSQTDALIGTLISIATAPG